MPLFTSFRQLLPNQRKAASDEGVTPDEATADQKDTAAGDGTSDREETAAGAPDGSDPDKAVAGRSRRKDWRKKHPAAALAVARGTTVLAAVLVLFALLLPNELARLTPSAFLRMPVEAIYGTALLLVLPARGRRAAAVCAGVVLGLLTILKCIDMGFYSILDRPFDLVLDWVLFDDAEEFLRESVGQAGAIGAVIGIVLLVLFLLVVMTLAVIRLGHLVIRHKHVATRATLVLGIAWMTISVFGLQAVEGIPFASQATSRLVEHRTQQVQAGVADEREFAKLAAVDRFRDTPGDELLTGLRGKDVTFAFIESYGRSAIEDPEMAPHVGSALSEGTSKLREAGFSSQSGWLKSPTTGAGSWLAHSTFSSGLWIDNEQRYRTATASDRMTLTGAFRRANGWRTVGVMPGVRRSWPEGQFYDFDDIYDSKQLGYKGPMFSWSPVPDQYSMAAFERLEHGKRDRKPLASEIILATSHNPWAPLPRMLDWDELGDGSVYHSIKKAGKDPKEVWQDPRQVRTEYRRAIEYSVDTLTSYMEKYGDKDSVLVFLGDHQPVPTVTAGNHSRDVPISIVAKDPKVMDRISDWGWQDGLKPGKKTPVVRMDKFRDRFMTAYGPQKPDSSPEE